MQTVGVVNSLTPKLEYFLANDDVKVGGFCIVETSRGVEFVKVVEVDSKYNAEKEIIRLANKDDIKKNTGNILAAKEILPSIKNVVKKQNLEMKITKCEYTFDMEKLIIH